ncbi:MAG: DUF2269 family protein [Solirubrobacteraceae bacterium]
MATPLAASAYEYVLALHIIAVVVAFGWTFALPVAFSVAARHDPRSLPVLHRIEVAASRRLLNPALVVLLAAGIFLASDGHHWKEFFVQWGLAVAIIIGGVVGAVLIPTSKRAEVLATRDLAAAGGSEFEPSDEYRALARRLNLVGTALWLLVLVTIVLMATGA